VSRKAVKRGASGLLVAGALALGACGGDDDGGGGGGAEGSGKRFADKAAESPRPFVRQFQRITGVRLKPVGGDLFGTRLEVPPKPNRFERFGAYSLVWTRDEEKRELFLGKSERDGDGIYWRRVGSSYSASKPYGDHLVLRWVGRQEKETNEQWERLERAVEASLSGTLGPLEPEERPCGEEDLKPLSGPTGECAVNGLPVTFVEADSDLEVPALKAKVLGYEYAGQLSNPGVAPLRARGRFLIVGYRVENTSDAPISFIQPQLRTGTSTIPESPDAAALLPRSRPLPLPPGASVVSRSAFDVGSDVDPAGAAIVFPAEREGRREPSLFLAQGWIRLGKAPKDLPKPRRGRQEPASGGSSRS
jgi:hypothetical protein